MRLKISNRAEAFFDLFTESAENLRSAAELLQDLIGDYRDVELKAQRIADREHEGDEVTHAIIRLLNTTFVTPMDREDIYQLATALDDVMDAIEAVSDLFVLHRIEAPLPEMKAQIDVLVLAAMQTEQALAALSKMKREQLEPLLDRDQPARERGRPALPASDRGPVLGRASRPWTSSSGRRSSRTWRRRSTASRTSPTSSSRRCSSTRSSR